MIGNLNYKNKNIERKFLKVMPKNQFLKVKRIERKRTKNQERDF